MPKNLLMVGIASLGGRWTSIEAQAPKKDGFVAPKLALQVAQISGVKMERETGIEPATNSLEGCDSTTELLPRVCRGLTAKMVEAGGFEPP